MSTKFKVDVSGAEVSVDKATITVKGKEGTVKAEIKYPFIHVTKKDNIIFIEADRDIDYQKAIVGTLAADLKNMVKGVNEKYTAELELIYMHFPASVKVIDGKLVVENFVGERKPREIQLPKEVDVKVNGTKIKISGIDKYTVYTLTGIFPAILYLFSTGERKPSEGTFL